MRAPAGCWESSTAGNAATTRCRRRTRDRRAEISIASAATIFAAGAIGITAAVRAALMAGAADAAIGVAATMVGVAVTVIGVGGATAGGAAMEIMAVVTGITAGKTCAYSLLKTI